MPRSVILFRRQVARRAPAALLVFSCLLLEGCYYMQAIRGHAELMRRRRPVAEVIADDQSPEALTARLELLQTARDFAVAELLLPDNDSYRSYADLDRDYVVWNVFAAPEFSLEPKTWCYPVAGCVAYRGYFAESAARKLEAKLRDDGFDVYVGGVAAYSTLGRFSDPVLNTMMRWSDVDLVSTMFHELAHQRLYVKGDSAFNESFATLVADIGIERWLDRRGERERLQINAARKQLQRAMHALVRETRESLETLYGSDLDENAKRSRKRSLLDQLSADSERLVAEDGSGVGNWLAAPLNNARLVLSNLYEGRVDAFRAMFEDCAQDIACFYARAESISELDKDDRQAALDSLDSRSD